VLAHGAGPAEETGTSSAAGSGDSRRPLDSSPGSARRISGRSAGFVPRSAYRASRSRMIAGTATDVHPLSLRDAYAVSAVSQLAMPGAKAEQEPSHTTQVFKCHFSNGRLSRIVQHGGSSMSQLTSTRACWRPARTAHPHRRYAREPRRRQCRPTSRRDTGILVNCPWNKVERASGNPDARPAGRARRRRLCLRIHDRHRLRGGTTRRGRRAGDRHRAVPRHDRDADVVARGAWTSSSVRPPLRPSLPTRHPPRDCSAGARDGELRAVHYIGLPLLVLVHPLARN
jgi:hypothetical protein